jgi:iron complex transport system ATP-binding protein
MTALVARDLEFAYGAAPVLRGVSLDLEGGEVVALVGPNGSGKTTLLRSLAGLLNARGDIHYGDAPLDTLTQRERAHRRAYVPQRVAVVFPYRVVDVVGMGLASRARFYGAPISSECVDAALSEVGFAPSRHQRFDRLSGGERQQVVVARALVQEADIILLDEPTSALDLRHRAAIIGALRRRAAAGAAVLVSLHDLNLAALACDRLLLLADGEIVANGPPATVLSQEMIERVYGVPVACGTHHGVPTVQLDPRAWST